MAKKRKRAKKPAPPKKREWSMRFVVALASVGLHVVALLVLGPLILFPGYIGSGSIVGEIGAEEVIPEIPVEVEERGDDSSEIPLVEAMGTEATEVEPIESITALNSDLLSPAGSQMQQVMVGKHFFGGSGASSLKGGMGPKGMRGKKIFGVTIEATKLGVIIDGSGTMGPYVRQVLDEVIENFSGAEVVLTYGCGMGNDYRGIVVPASKPVELEEGVARYLREEPREKVMELINGKRKVWAMPDLDESIIKKEIPLAGDREIMSVTQKVAVLRTRMAFEHLREQGVDGIYWFADFRDPMDPKIVETLTTELEAAKIRVYMHRSGRAPPADQHFSEEGGLRSMMDRTQGGLISKQL